MEIVTCEKRCLWLFARQNLLAMKMILCLLLVGVIQVSAKSYSQSVTYSGKNVALSEVFRAIEKQTNYVFFYDDAELAKSKPVTIACKNEAISIALENLLHDQPFNYVIKSNTIFIKARSSAFINMSTAANALIAEVSANISGVVKNEKGERLSVRLLL